MDKNLLGTFEISFPKKLPLSEVFYFGMAALFSLLIIVGLVGSFITAGNENRRDQLNRCVQMVKEPLQCKHLFE